MDRRCPDCGVSMEDVQLRTYDMNKLWVKTGERREGLLGRLGMSERLDVQAMLCPECGLIRTYADVDEIK